MSDHSGLRPSLPARLSVYGVSCSHAPSLPPAKSTSSGGSMALAFTQSSNCAKAPFGRRVVARGPEVASRTTVVVDDRAGRHHTANRRVTAVATRVVSARRGRAAARTVGGATRADGGRCRLRAADALQTAQPGRKRRRTASNYRSPHESPSPCIDHEDDSADTQFPSTPHPAARESVRGCKSIGDGVEPWPSASAATATDEHPATHVRRLAGAPSYVSAPGPLGCGPPTVKAPSERVTMTRLRDPV